MDQRLFPTENILNTLVIVSRKIMYLSYYSSLCFYSRTRSYTETKMGSGVGRDTMTEVSPSVRFSLIV